MALLLQDNYQVLASQPQLVLRVILLRGFNKRRQHVSSPLTDSGYTSIIMCYYHFVFKTHIT